MGASDIAAGVLVNASHFDELRTMVGAWTSYGTPDLQWTASTTNPSLGNGSISAKYLDLGGIVIYAGTLTIGSTTTLGTGEWRMSVPVTATSTVAGGGGSIIDASTSTNDRSLGVGFFDTSTIRFFTSSGLASSTVPITWASGDTLTWLAIYEPA